MKTTLVRAIFKRTFAFVDLRVAYVVISSIISTLFLYDYVHFVLSQRFYRGMRFSSPMKYTCNLALATFPKLMRIDMIAHVETVIPMAIVSYIACPNSFKE